MQFQQLRHSCLFLVEVGCLVLLLACCTTPSRLGHLCYRLSVNGMASTCICGWVLIIYIAFHALTVPFSTNGQSLKRVNYFGVCHANSWFLQVGCRQVMWSWGRFKHHTVAVSRCFPFHVRDGHTLGSDTSNITGNAQ